LPLLVYIEEFVKFDEIIIGEMQGYSGLKISSFLLKPNARRVSRRICKRVVRSISQRSSSRLNLDSGYQQKQFFLLMICGWAVLTFGALATVRLISLYDLSDEQSIGVC
jgi:hypothetical protein